MRFAGLPLGFPVGVKSTAIRANWLTPVVRWARRTPGAGRARPDAAPRRPRTPGDHGDASEVGAERVPRVQHRGSVLLRAVRRAQVLQRRLPAGPLARSRPTLARAPPRDGSGSPSTSPPPPPPPPSSSCTRPAAPRPAAHPPRRAAGELGRAGEQRGGCDGGSRAHRGRRWSRGAGRGRRRGRGRGHLRRTRHAARSIEVRPVGEVG